METWERHEFAKGMLDRKDEGWRYDRFLFREMSERMTRILEREKQSASHVPMQKGGVKQSASHLKPNLKTRKI